MSQSTLNQHRPASPALSRFTVIDLSRVRSGPTASRQLADWGANVISIEQPASLDDSDPHVGPRLGSDFQNLNRNRRGITLNLKTPDGIEILKKLVAEADVVIENFRPDVKHRLGIDYEALSAVNPRLVYASISGFGQDGPYRDRPGFDQIAQGMGGIMQVTGVPGAGPLRAGISVGDLTAGLFCAYGILVALLERDVSGRGQWVQTSLLQALAFMLDFQAARWLMDGAVPKQHGNFHPTIAPCGTFRTKDSHINLALVGQTMWERLCDAFGKPEWREDPEFRTNADRLAHSARLKSEIEEVLATENSAYWVEHLNAKSVACGPIYGVDEMFDDAQFRSLGMVQALDGDRGAVSYLGQPIVLTRTPSGIVKHPPRLGEDTDDVLAAVGYSPDDVAGFRAAHIV